MPRRRPATLLLVSFLLNLALPAAGQHLAGRVTAVHDGDTITVQTPRGPVRVRLVGIDCPERGQPFSARARRFTSELVLGRDVRIEEDGRDRYDRILGRVFVGPRDVNRALVEEGLAWRYERDGDGDPALADAERAARAARRGVWSTSNPVPPWQWRREHPRDDGKAAPPPVPAANARGPLRGNTRSRVFHKPGCPNYTCRNCTELFLSEASARDAGYRPAADCHR